jgi:hypothetical protein
MTRRLLGFTDITSPTNERTMIATIIPFAGVGHTMPLIFPKHEPIVAVSLLLANLNSFAFDYIGRQKIGGIHYTYFILKQIPVLAHQQYKEGAENRILIRVLELSYTGCDMRPFAEEIWTELHSTDQRQNNFFHGPFIWDKERRFLIRCELDAIYFHLYGVNRDDVAYIMDTFPIVKRKDEQRYGEYRTKRVILERYDHMAEAIKTGRPCQTILDPPPADPRVAHPPRKEKT